MMWIPRPIRPLTSADFSVLFWIAVLLFIGFGIVCLYFAYGAPPEKTEEAAKLIRGGLTSIAVGLGMLAIRRFFCGFSQ